MKHFDLMGKLLGIALIFFVAACQSSVVIVTATPLPSTPIVIVVTATPRPTVVNPPTHTSTPVLPTIAPTGIVASPTAIVVTPTAEVYRPHQGCALLNPYWSDPVDGCLVNRNGNFTQGLAVINGVPLPLRWSLWRGANSIPMECTNSGCKFTTNGTQPFASTGIAQRVTGIEQGQCYLIKAVYTFRLKTSAVDPNRDFTKPPEDFPVNNVFAIVRVNNTDLDGRLFERERNNPNLADANFISGTREYIWAIRGGASDEATMTVGLRLQFGSTLPGSHVDLIGAYWLAAPDGFCQGS